MAETEDQGLGDWQYLNEDDQTFQLKHPDGSTFNIAKQGIGQTLADKIREMKPTVANADDLPYGVDQAAEENSPYGVSPSQTPVAAPTPRGSSVPITIPRPPSNEIESEGEVKPNETAPRMDQ